MSDQCAYMRSAYPTLDAEDTCGDHRHEPRIFALAKALAEVFQQPDPSDEQIAWFIDDADSVADDFPGVTEWKIDSPDAYPNEFGVEALLTINGRHYVLPESELEPSTPVSRAEWDSWHEDEEADS